MNEFEKRNQSLEWAKFDVGFAIANIIISFYFCLRFKKLFNAINQPQHIPFKESAIWSMLCMMFSIVASIAKIMMKISVLLAQPNFIVDVFHCDASSCTFCVVNQRIFSVTWLLRFCCFCVTIIQTASDHFTVKQNDVRSFKIAKIGFIVCQTVVVSLEAIFKQSRLYMLSDAEYITCFETPGGLSAVTRPINGALATILTLVLLILVFKQEYQVKFYLCALYISSIPCIISAVFFVIEKYI